VRQIALNAALSWSNAITGAPVMRSGAARSIRVVAVLGPLNHQTKEDRLVKKTVTETHDLLEIRL